jgi:hypothetical protein
MIRAVISFLQSDLPSAGFARGQHAQGFAEPSTATCFSREVAPATSRKLDFGTPTPSRPPRGVARKLTLMPAVE